MRNYYDTGEMDSYEHLMRLKEDGNCTNFRNRVVEVYLECVIRIEYRAVV